MIQAVREVRAVPVIKIRRSRSGRNRAIQALRKSRTGPGGRRCADLDLSPETADTQSPIRRLRPRAMAWRSLCCVPGRRLYLDALPRIARQNVRSTEGVSRSATKSTEHIAGPSRVCESGVRFVLGRWTRKNPCARRARHFICRSKVASPTRGVTLLALRLTQGHDAVMARPMHRDAKPSTVMSKAVMVALRKRGLVRV